MAFLAGDTNTALGRPRTYLNVVLDESSSMDVHQDATIRAYNDFIAEQRATSAVAKDEVFVTLTKFSDAQKVKVIYRVVPLDKVTPLTRAAYAPEGMTALYDGIFHAIRAMEKSVGDQARVLTVVLTDGMENHSKEIDSVETMREIIQSREARGNWTFVFLSAGDAPFTTGQGMGFQPGNINTYSAAQVGSAMAVVGRGVRTYRSADAMQTDTFFTGAPKVHEAPAWTQSGGDDVKDVV